MGLLDYYRQFDDLDEETINRGLRERRARERALALERVPTIDLSSAEWPDFPNSEIVNASIAAVNDRTRLVTICNPNDPTGTYVRSDELAELIGSLPDHVHVLLDEDFIQFQDVEPEDACLRLLDAFPRLLVFRTFSKIYGLSGLRAGYVVGSTASGDILSALAPALGISVLTQAGLAQALKIGDPEIARRRAMVIEQRGRLLRALHDLPVDAPDSQANFVWLHASGLTGPELAGGLERAGVIVAHGGPLGADDHVRASIRGGGATDRLLSALASVTAR